MSLWLLIPLLLAVLLIRTRWIIWNVDQYSAAALYWAWRTKQPAQIVRDMSELWPASHILWAVWLWDFRCFVVHQHLYDTIQDFLIVELEREDRGLEMFDRPPDKKPPEEDNSTHGPN